MIKKKIIFLCSLFIFGAVSNIDCNKENEGFEKETTIKNPVKYNALVSKYKTIYCPNCNKANQVLKDVDITESQQKCNYCGKRLDGSDLNSGYDRKGDAKISGSFYWYDCFDDEDCSDLIHAHLLRNNSVSIYNSNNNSIIAENIKISDNGSFSYTFKNESREERTFDFYFKVFAGNDKIHITDAQKNEYFYKSNNIRVYSGYPTEDVSNALPVITMESEKGQAFQIGQAMMLGDNFTKSRAKNFECVDVIYPANVDVCNYLAYDKTIRIKKFSNYSSEGEIPQEELFDEQNFNEWTIMLHEYGHFVEHQLGCLNMISYEHFPKDCMSHVLSFDPYNSFRPFYTDEDAKEDGIKYAWQEAWAYIFAKIVLSTYSDKVSDIEYVYSNIDSYERMNVAVGESCESSIIGFLWDLYDASNDKSKNSSQVDDQISMSAAQWFDITTKNQTQYFSQFVSNFYSQYGSASTEGKNFNKLLTFYKMTAYKPLVFIDGTTTTSIPASGSLPSFRWDSQTVNKMGVFANDSFGIIIYDENDNEILRTARTDKMYINLSITDWQKILASGATKISAAVSAIQSIQPVTGEYISERSKTIDIPNRVVKHSITVSNNNRYSEYFDTLGLGQSLEYDFVFTNSGNIIFQTFGTDDTKMYLYDLNGNCLANNDDGGNALNSFIKFYVVANIKYTLKVTFYSCYSYGKIKTTITPISSNHSWTSFSNLPSLAINSLSNITYSTTVNLNRYTSEVVVLKPAVTKTVQIRLQYLGSKIDTYLYVADTSVTSSALYNDDGASDNQASLTMKLEAGKNYYVVISAYNITTMTPGSVKLTVC